jgi:hypothetical protein
MKKLTSLFLVCALAGTLSGCGGGSTSSSGGTPGTSTPAGSVDGVSTPSKVSIATTK